MNNLRSIEEKYKEVYFSLLVEGSSGVLNQAIITKYEKVADVSSATAYRHFNLIKGIFDSKREYHEPSKRRKKFITLRDSDIKTDMDLERFKQTVMDLEQFKQTVLAMEGDDKLKAFVLETIRLYPEYYIVIGKAANKRVKTLKIEKKIAQHEMKIKELRRQLK